jgi:hypothetical protein
MTSARRLTLFVEPLKWVCAVQFAAVRLGEIKNHTLPAGLRAMAALAVLRNKAIKPLLAAAQALRPTGGPHNPRPIDTHYHAIQVAMHGVFHELGLAA